MAASPSQNLALNCDRVRSIPPSASLLSSTIDGVREPSAPRRSDDGTIGSRLTVTASSAVPA
eukprot:SAG31_NODE_409_length_16006_cov_10.345760_6_plen_62_part_00